jgi:hypothetical protein
MPAFADRKATNLAVRDELAFPAAKAARVRLVDNGKSNLMVNKRLKEG